MLSIEQCYGFIVFKEKQNTFLILERVEKKGDWTFPKGHQEEGESPKETALRELEEETGIKEIQIANLPIIHEEYEIIKKGEKRLKNNGYFIGFVKENTIVNIEKEELQSYKWANYEEAMILFNREERRQVLVDAKRYLDNMIK